MWKQAKSHHFQKLHVVTIEIEHRKAPRIRDVLGTNPRHRVILLNSQLTSSHSNGEHLQLFDPCGSRYFRAEKCKVTITTRKVRHAYFRTERTWIDSVISRASVVAVGRSAGLLAQHRLIRVTTYSGVPGHNAFKSGRSPRVNLCTIETKSGKRPLASIHACARSEKKHHNTKAKAYLAVDKAGFDNLQMDS